MPFAQPGKDSVFDAVERSKVDMAALCGRDAVCAIGFAVEVRHAEACAGAEDGQPAGCRKRPLGTGHVQELVFAGACNGMGHRFEIIDDRIGIDAKLLTHHRGTDDPGVVGEADDIPADGTCNGHRNAGRQAAAHALAVIFPRGLKAHMVFSVQGFRFAQGNAAVIGDGRDGKAGVRSANVDADEFHVLQSCHCEH